MTKLTRIGVLFLAKLVAVAMMVAGLFAGLLYSVGGLVYDVATTGGVNAGTALAFLAIPGMPLLFAVAGFVLGAALAVLYNIATRRYNGIVFDSSDLTTTEDVQP